MGDGRGLLLLLLRKDLARDPHELWGGSRIDRVLTAFSGVICMGLTSVNITEFRRLPLFLPRLVATNPGSTTLAVTPVPSRRLASSRVYVVSISLEPA